MEFQKVINEKKKTRKIRKLIINKPKRLKNKATKQQQRTNTKKRETVKITCCTRASVCLEQISEEISSYTKLPVIHSHGTNKLKRPANKRKIEIANEQHSVYACQLDKSS